MLGGRRQRKIFYTNWGDIGVYKARKHYETKPCLFMKSLTLLICALFVSSLAGCSKHSPDTTRVDSRQNITSTSQTNLVVLVGTNHYTASFVVTLGTNSTRQTNLDFQVGTNHFRLAKIVTLGTNASPQTNEVSK